MSSSAIEFWNQVGSTDADVERLYNFLLERGNPAPSRDLATHLIDLRWREEQERMALAAARTSPVYQPKQSYTVGQTIHFPALANREGVVKKIRASDNPRLGEFEIIAVKFEGETALREFAMAYPRPHPLNEEPEQKRDALNLSQAETHAQYGESVRTRIVQCLGAKKDFVHATDFWFLRELIPPINPGYLNIAEAAIEASGDAVRTTELVKILEMADTKGATATFAVNAALATDPRFDEVGPIGDSRWFLTQLEPPEALAYPQVLRAITAHVAPLAPELETIAAELQDEADPSTDSGQALNGNARTPVPGRDEVTVVLTYPHRRAGTLPLTPAVRALAPNFSNPRLKLAFQDTSERKISAIAVNEGNYIAGLTPWYNAWKLAPGAMLTLKRGADPLTLVIDPQLQRERALWIRVARVIGGRLTFGTERRPLAHKYDEEMLIVVGDVVGLEQLSESAQAKLSLALLLEEIFPELAKLSSAGTVHAKTIYSAVNFVRRAGPRAVLSALSENRAMTSSGGGYFVLNETRR